MLNQISVGEGQRLRLIPHSMGSHGEAVAHLNGKRVFVFGGIPGEEVVVEVIRERRDYIATRVVNEVIPASDRTEAPCPYYGICTGCQWQHISYQRQLQLKRDVVAQALAQIGGFVKPPVQPTLPSPQPYNYRNHARFTVERNGFLGFVNRETRRHVTVDRCLLMHSEINRTLSTLQGRCQGMTQLSIRYGVNTGSRLIQPLLQQPDIPLESGQKHYEEKVGGRVFRVMGSSFFQVNIQQTERLVKLVESKLELMGGDVLVDAYAGVGVFTALLAPCVRKVVAIEESSSAVKDAQANIEGLSNVEFRRGKVEDVLMDLDETPDAVILDPPRTGCHHRVLEALICLAPRRVVYVSCDPQSQAEDLRVLCAGSFRLEEVQPVDMFPQTHHVESVATLVLDQERRARWEGRQHLVLASASPRRREILCDLGMTFQVVPSLQPEEPVGDASPVELAERRAKAKVRAIASDRPDGIVIGADTVVVDLETGDVLGKPITLEEAAQMLRRLRGKEHRVITGVAVMDAATGHEVADHRSTRVVMRQYSDQEIAAYVASGQPLDKAGGYAVQDPVLHPAAEVCGCYLNVVGLPPCTLVRLLKQLDVWVRVDPQWTPPGQCHDCRRLSDVKARD